MQRDPEFTCHRYPTLPASPTIEHADGIGHDDRAMIAPEQNDANFPLPVLYGERVKVRGSNRLGPSHSHSPPLAPFNWAWT